MVGARVAFITLVELEICLFPWKQLDFFLPTHRLKESRQNKGCALREWSYNREHLLQLS
jgi:hypothetical protein